ncbi:hypothetical protein GKZ89_10925 [Bacillus mangrovi]|uniref:Lipoprotein n=1 Tax=Metabacillus mangrovi TaxID=1491830 RepID=A0A7X2S613_9BACI|nr:DUF6612 family protein [Metabacillus mangrovi]MTH53918.1 hypothetical protein [Metabacillus mangrovi]
MKITLKVTSLFLVLSIALFGCGAGSSEKTSESESSKEAAAEEKPAEKADTEEAAAEENSSETVEVSTAEEEAPPAEEEMDAEQALKKSMEAYAQITSFSSEMDIQQMIDDGETKIDVSGTLKSENSYEPFIIHNKDTYNGNGQTINSEYYITEDATYASQNGAEWTKEPTPGALIQPKPEDQLKSLVGIADLVDFEENEEGYVISISSTDQEVLGAYSDMVTEAAAALGTDGSSVKVTSLDMSYTLDKETFLQKTADVTLDMTASIEGQEVKMNQSMNGTFGQYNEIKDLAVPQEIMDSAK